MFGDHIVVRTRLLPPRLPRRWLRRARLDRLLSSIAEYPLTVVHASAGYGKSTALASLLERHGWPVAWYSLGEGSDDPLIFLVHLTYAFRTPFPGVGEPTLSMLVHGSGGAQAWAQALDLLLNDLVGALTEETVLVLDDYHSVDDVADVRLLIERLIEGAPPLLHIILSTRRRPQLACIPAMQVRGELLEIGERDLAFTSAEIEDLFRSAYESALTPEEQRELAEQTGGWAIALQLIWQGRRRGKGELRNADFGLRNEEQVLGVRSQVLETKGEPPTPNTQHPAPISQSSQEALFAYLAREVLDRQPAEIQDFLLRSSTLSEMRADVCDRVLDLTDSAARLDDLYRRGLFLTALGDGLYRYHPLFHSFLEQQARARLDDWKGLHTRAVAYYREVGAGEEVLYHLMAVGDTEGAVAELERLAPEWLDSGKLVTLVSHIEELPANTLAEHPRLLLARGDAARLLVRFAQALASYEEARRIYSSTVDAVGEAEALRGEALVYLDTVQPASAEGRLRRAYRLLPESYDAKRAELLRLMAENRLNAGRPDQAQRLLSLAGVPPTGGDLQARILLRLGRLEEARAQLEADLPRYRDDLLRGRAVSTRREVLLLLSLICAMHGDAPAALHYAEEGMEAAQRLGSPLLQAQAHICLGHALLLRDASGAANEHYLQALSLAGALAAARSTQADAYLGLALLHGFGLEGDIAAAETAAREGLSIAEQSGDEWTVSYLWLARGATGVVHDTPAAEEWLREALRRFRLAQSAYGEAVGHLWLSVLYHRRGDTQRATYHALETFRLSRRYNYDGLLISPSLYGPRDRMMLVPLLLAARAERSFSGHAQSLLSRGFPLIAGDTTTQTYHPGVTLRVQMLGPLRVWRGNDEIGQHEWQRKRAQQMLALLLTHRDRWLLREQICEWLWPEESPQEAESQFKVTLNGLNTALEPSRPPRTPPFYIRRQGSAYRFAPPEGVWLDVTEFEQRVARARPLVSTGDEESLAAAQEELSAAVELHNGEYLSDWLYEDWAREERERLNLLYLEAATLLADLLVRRDDLFEAIRICELVLSRDPSWEDAYGVLMRAYAKQGNRRQAIAIWERCVRNLREYLDVAPLPRTVQIYEEIKS